MGHANAHALSRVPSRFSIHVHPSQSNDILQAVREQLAGLLLKYSEDLQGVVLAFYQERVLSKQAQVDPYFPFLHVEVAADVLLFQPRPGMQLVGAVNAVGADYISVLVLGVFNAAIGAEHIRKDFRAQPQEQRWVNKRQPGEVIGLGSSVCFTVQRVLDHVSVFGLAGALLEPGTGLVMDHHHQQQQQQQTHKQKKVKDKEKQQQQQQQQSKADKGASAAAPEGGKKRKADAAQQQQQQQQQHLNGVPEKKQKRPKEAAAEQQPGPGSEQAPGHTHKKLKKQKDQSSEGQQQQQQLAVKDPGSSKKGKDQQQQAGQANGHLQPHKQQSSQEQQKQESCKKTKHKKHKQQVPS